MKKVELESLVKSFLLFFISQGILVSAIFFLEYKKELRFLDDSILSEMRVCSYDLACEEFEIDFAPLDESKLYVLNKENGEFISYFPITTSTKNALKIFLVKNKYESKVEVIENKILSYYLIVLSIVFLLSMMFSFYSLAPFREALRVTEEFIKDILHDFNTPLSTLRLNSSMLQTEFGENAKVRRIQNAVQTILSLQSNLRSYLDNHSSQKESFELEKLIKTRVSNIENNYPNLIFKVNIESTKLNANVDAFSRIIDNLISNAAKYNSENGIIEISFSGTTLKIKDNGKGIENPKKVFERFYKEQARGIGIGLHIVKKLCDELNVDISLQSKLNEGSTFRLNLKNLYPSPD